MIIESTVKMLATPTYRRIVHPPAIRGPFKQTDATRPNTRHHIAHNITADTPTFKAPAHEIIGVAMCGWWYVVV